MIMIYIYSHWQKIISETKWIFHEWFQNYYTFYLYHLYLVCGKLPLNMIYNIVYLQHIYRNLVSPKIQAGKWPHVWDNNRRKGGLFLGLWCWTDWCWKWSPPYSSKLFTRLLSKGLFIKSVPTIYMPIFRTLVFIISWKISREKESVKDFLIP